MKRPLQAEIDDFIERELGISPNTNYELVPMSGPKGFEFYMIVFRTLHRLPDETWSEDISISVFWPQNKNAPTAQEMEQLRHEIEEI